MNTFHLDIVTPSRNAFSENVVSISVPTLDGTIMVFAHHVPLFTALGDGEIKITTASGDRFLAIGGGFMEVTKSGVSILVSRALHANELNAAEIEKAKRAAEEVLANEVSEMERSEAQAILRRSILELKVVRRHRPSLTA